MATKRAKKKGRKKTPRKSDRGNAALLRRVVKLEAAVAALDSSSTIAAVPFAQPVAPATFSVLGTTATAGAVVEVKFAKLPGSPQLVRVEMKGHGDIISEGGDSGSLKNLSVGTWIVVWIHVSGNPGQSAKIKVTGAVENEITVTLTSGQRSEPRNLLVTG